MIFLLPGEKSRHARFVGVCLAITIDDLNASAACFHPKREM